MTDLTDRQREVLDYLRNYIGTHGFAPSMRDLGYALGMRSPATVARHFEVLERKGYIRRRGPRAVEILPEAQG